MPATPATASGTSRSEIGVRRRSTTGSATTDPEPSLVGTAAGSLTYTEELAEPTFLWPSADESLAFIAEYETERGEAFTTPERQSALAACVYLRAYAARCSMPLGRARSAGLAAFATALLG